MLFDETPVTLQLSVNSEKISLDVAPLKRLIDILREDLQLLGTKEGCGEGECGACAVMIDGEIACSCLVPAFQVQGTHVETIESVAQTATMSVVQEQMVRCGGTQCGICTPGIVMTCEALLKRNPTPTSSDIKEALAGNLCRCTGYTRIFEAIAKASQVST